MPLNILFPHVGGDIIGGSDISSLTVAANLNPARYRARVLLHGEAGRLGAYVESLGLNYDVLPDVPIVAPAIRRRSVDTNLAGYFTRTLWKLRRTARMMEIDIVQTNDGRMHSNWALPTRLAGARHLWYQRGDPTARGVNILGSVFADHLLSVSHFAMPPWAKRKIGTRADVVRSPFIFSDELPDRGAERDRVCREIAAPADVVLLGYVGFLTLRKRPETFVEIVARTRESMPGRDVRGVFFGSTLFPGSDVDARVKARARALGIENRIHLMGFRTPIAGPMSTLDALVVPALNEPFGRTLIEAMDLGVPVIAARHGGNIEAITHEETGFLVPPDDLDGFARYAAQVATDELCRARITRAAREAVHWRFGLERSVEAVQRTYDRMMARKPRRRRGALVGDAPAEASGALSDGGRRQ